MLRFFCIFANTYKRDSMKKMIMFVLIAVMPLLVNAQTGLNRVYNEDLDPMAQIDEALGVAKADGKFVVLDAEGEVLHIQDSSFLEEGQGYSKEKVMLFFKNWTPKAVKE